MAFHLVYRDAHPTEDPELARIMYAGFRTNWPHNHFQALEVPLAPLPASAPVLLPAVQDSSDRGSAPGPPHPPLSKAQRRRLAYYTSHVAFARAAGGEVLVAVPSSSASGSATGSPILSNPKEPIGRFPAFASTSTSPPDSDPDPAQIIALVILLPSHSWPSWRRPRPALSSGYVRTALSFGARGWARMRRADRLADGVVNRAVSIPLDTGTETSSGAVEGAGVEYERGSSDGQGQRGRASEELGYVWYVVRNEYALPPPACPGQAEPAEYTGAATRLLQWALDRRAAADRTQADQGVWLDCATPGAQRAYERVGFGVVGEVEWAGRSMAQIRGREGGRSWRGWRWRRRGGMSGTDEAGREQERQAEAEAGPLRGAGAEPKEEEGQRLRVMVRFPGARSLAVP